MKKRIAALAAGLLLLWPFSARAMDGATAHAPGEYGIAVTGSCESRKDYYEIVLGAPLIDTVRLPGDTMISGASTSAEDTGLRVVIIPVTKDEEAQAYAWVQAAATELGQLKNVFYLAFYRGAEPAQPAGEVTLTVTAKQSAPEQLFYLSGEASQRQLTLSQGEQGNAFSMEQSGYYLFAKAKQAAPPRTGDTANLRVNLILLVLSGAAMLVLAAAWLRNKKAGQVQNGKTAEKSNEDGSV